MSCRERIALFLDYDTRVYTVEELAARYGISRETFYVWKRRRESGAEDWFEEFSRAPALVSSIVAMRKKFPRFGAKKIAAKLASERAQTAWPASSTIGGILKREGLVAPRAARRRPLLQSDLAECAEQGVVD